MKTILILLTAILCAEIQAQEVLFGRRKEASGPAFTPADISGILQFNYGDGDASGTGVDATWTATVGQNLTTDSSTGRPTKSTTSINGKSYATYNFDGGANFMTNGGTWTATAPYTRFAVFRLVTNSFTTTFRFLCSANGDSGRADLATESSPVFQGYYGGGSFQSYGVAPNSNWVYAVEIVDGANSRIRFNGGSWNVIGADAGSAAIHGLCLGALYSGGLVNPTAVNFESVGVIGNTNFPAWGASLESWMNGRIN